MFFPAQQKKKRFYEKLFFLTYFVANLLPSDSFSFCYEPKYIIKKIQLISNEFYSMKTRAYSSQSSFTITQNRTPIWTSYFSKSSPQKNPIIWVYYFKIQRYGEISV